MKAWAFLFLFFSPFAAEAAEECFDPQPIVERIAIWDFQRPSYTSFQLPSRNGQGIFLTQAAIHLSWNESLEIVFDFELPPDQVSLPYNVYQLQLEIGEGPEMVMIKKDFTENCTGHGISFFPGARVRILAPKFLPPPPATSLGTPLRITVWGR
jgi:hypothetical protein